MALLSVPPIDLPAEGSDPLFRCDLQRRSKRGLVVRVSGELDVATAPQLGEAVAEAEMGSPQVLLDLGEVSFMDCSGIRALMACRALGPAGPVRIVAASAAVRRVFAILAIDLPTEPVA